MSQQAPFKIKVTNR